MSEIYVKIEGIEGESKDAKHKGWIDAINLSYGVSQSSSVFTGGGGGVGKADFNGLAFTHYFDRASPNLFKYCAAGKHIATVEISGCKSGGGQQEFVHVKLSDVIVIGVTPNGNAGSMWVETVSLAYSQIVIEAKEQKADGSMVAGVSGGWNVKENKAIA
ncbi:MAG: type VI secretion system tube protein Hcp [Azoarcus sp.]|jgi:type VI secretion system secreted protein Hcp|nr:type VI secretion system tube protein Hcp [Azoarcus sp.]